MPPISEMKVNTLYISYTGLTEPLGQSQVLNYLKGLAEEYKITVISTEKEEIFQKTKDQIQQICDKYSIDWQPLPYHKKPPVFSTVKDIFAILHKAKSLHKMRNFRLVHCRSYIAALVGLELKKKFNIPFLFDMRGFWADERVEGNIWSVKNPIYSRMYKYFKAKEKQFFTRSDHIISLTKAGKQEIESWNINNSPISYIPTCVDFDLFDYHKISPQKVLEKKLELGISKNDFVLTYLGSVGTWYLTKEMLIVFEEILNENPDSAFLFITKENPEIVWKEVEKLNLPKEKIIITSSAREGVPLLLACSNASILFYKPKFSKLGTSPTKLGELMGMGIPVIGNKKIGDVEENVIGANAGIVIDVENDSELRKAGKEIIAFAGQINKEHLRSEAINRFDLEDGIKNYLKIYKRIIK